jgi:hypothetical protein
MSLFKKVVQEHEEKEAVKAAEKAASLTKEQQDRKNFEQRFNDVIASVAKPIFYSFVADAQELGYPANIEEGLDGYGNPIFAVHMIPEKGSKFRVDAAAEVCVFQLKGVVNKQDVEHSVYYDQRPNKNGVFRETYKIQSINESTIERGLTDFLTRSLAARAQK